MKEKWKVKLTQQSVKYATFPKKSSACYEDRYIFFYLPSSNVHLNIRARSFMGLSLGLHGMFPPAQLAQPLFYAIHSFAVEGKPCLFPYSRVNRHIA